MTVNCKSLDDLPAMLTAAELAGALGISRAGAYALIHRKDFPTLQIGKRLMVPKDKLMAWIDRQTAGTGVTCVRDVSKHWICATNPLGQGCPPATPGREGVRQ